MGMRQYRGWGIMMWQIKYKWSFEVAPAQAQIRHLLYFSHLMPLFQHMASMVSNSSELYSQIVQEAVVRCCGLIRYV